MRFSILESIGITLEELGTLVACTAILGVELVITLRIALGDEALLDRRIQSLSWMFADSRRSVMRIIAGEPAMIVAAAALLLVPVFATLRSAVFRGVDETPIALRAVYWALIGVFVCCLAVSASIILFGRPRWAIPRVIRERLIQEESND